MARRRKKIGFFEKLMTPQGLLTTAGVAILGFVVFDKGTKTFLRPTPEEEFGIKNGEFFALINSINGNNLTTFSGQGTQDISVLKLMELVDRGIIKIITIAFFSDKAELLKDDLQKIINKLQQVNASLNVIEVNRVVSESPVDKKDELFENIILKEVAGTFVLEVLVDKDILVKRKKGSEIIDVIIDIDILSEILVELAPIKTVQLFIAKNADVGFAQQVENFIVRERPGGVQLETIRIS